MKKIVAIVLSLVMLVSTFAVIDTRVSAKTKKGYYFAVMQKKKTPWGYLKKAKVLDNLVVVTQTVQKATQPATTQAADQATQNAEETTTQAPVQTTVPSTETVTKVVKKSGALDRIVTYGTFMYRKTDSGAGNIIKAKKRTFVISQKCKFYDKYWNSKKKKKLKRADALKRFKKIKKTSKNECEFVVKGGKVVAIRFGQE